MRNARTIETLFRSKVCVRREVDGGLCFRNGFRASESTNFFSLSPLSPAGHTVQLASYCCSLRRGSLSSLVYITYFFVSVCKCVKCIYNVLSLPVYYDTTIACDTLALGVLQVVSHALLLKQWFPCHCCHRYMRTILSPLVWRAQSCCKTCVC